VLLGVERGDAPAQADWLAAKLAGLRIFGDEQQNMNRSLLDIDGEALVISQFTLAGDCRKGRRPSFDKAMPPDRAEPLYRHFCTALRAQGVKQVAEGVFGAMMDVALVNAGPVTFVLERQPPAG
jgi:D-tyrosyl-tRNA(Tyr) deacylase